MQFGERGFSPPVESLEYSISHTEVEQDPFQKYKELFRELGLLPDSLGEKLLQRYALLDQKTQTLDDERRAIGYADRLAGWQSERYSANRLDSEELKAVKLATLFTDIGKTGPKDASPEQQELITAMYGIDEKINPQTMTVHQYLERFFPKDAAHHLHTFSSMGLDAEMTMRSFFDLHAGWSYDLLKEGGAPLQTTATAAAHHFLEGVNPEGILDKEGNFTHPEIARPLDEREIFVILFDKYDAARRRGKKTHEEAIQWIQQNRFNENPHFRELPMPLQHLFESCLQELDEALLPESARVMAGTTKV